jgi:hypothetical protein
MSRRILKQRYILLRLMDIFVEMLTLMTAGYKEGIRRKPQR